MTDPIIAAARASADRLVTEYGPGLAIDVENALFLHEKAQRPDQYDPVTVGTSISTAIVAIANLAWAIYTEQQKKRRDPSRDAVSRRVRAKLRRQNCTSQSQTDEIIEIVVSEIFQIIERQP